MITDPLTIYEALREEQRAEDDMARKPIHIIGPYTVHLASLGWYCVMKRGEVVQTCSSATEAAFWAAMQEDA